jgi:DNA-binding PadR family transcriptional regulator
MLKYALLGLLAGSPKHGYELKTELESAFGGNWELNFGQIYTTLSRLERDRLVTVQAEDRDGRGKKTYEITTTGRAELTAWFETPVEKPRQLRDEFFLKLIIGRLAGEEDSSRTINRQRQAYFEQMGSLTAMAPTVKDPMVALLIEGAILHLQADLRWLDLCDEKLEPSPAGEPAAKRKPSGKE